MSLPIDILISRLRNELTICSRYLRHPVNTSEENLSRFPLDIEIELVKVPGSVLQDGKVVTRYNHSFSIIVTREYPFEKPLVIWRTPIFHPNIWEALKEGSPRSRSFSFKASKVKFFISNFCMISNT
jgi:hypothetical protein